MCNNSCKLLQNIGVNWNTGTKKVKISWNINICETDFQWFLCGMKYKKHLPGVFIHCILNLENPHYQHRGQRNIQVSLLHSKTKKYNNKNKIIDIPIE